MKMVTTCGKPRKKKLKLASVLGVSPGDEQLISRYLKSLESESASVRSLRLKRWQLQSLAKSTPLTDADEDALVDFINKPAWGPDTRKSARSTIRGFYTWAHRKGLVSHNPAMYLRSVRVPAGRPRPVPEGP